VTRGPTLSRTVQRGLALLALALGGCGYKSGFVLPEGESIGVKVFGNDSKLRDVEMRLHPYLTDAVQRLVGAELVGPDRASVWIEGAVLEYVRRGGIRSPDNVQLETGVQIVVLARLVRRVENQPDSPPTQVLREVTVGDERGYLLGDPLGESRAVASVLRNIADRVVLDLMSDLAYEDAPVVELRGANR
jgi:hypothetical protein